MLYKKHYVRNLRLALPVMLANAGHMAVGIFDTLMVGQYSSTALSASAFANSVFANILVFGIGFSTGLTPIVGQAQGEGKESEVRNFFKQGLFTNLGLGLLLVLFCLALYPFLGQMGQASGVAELAAPYYLSLSFSLFPFMGFLALKQFAEGLEQTRQATIFTLLSNVVNVVFNYALIYGKWGFPELGLLGAGIATLISRVFLFFGFAFYLMRSTRFASYWKNWSEMPLTWAAFVRLCKMGLPIAAQIVMEVAAFTLGALMVGWVGEKPLAAHQIAMSAASFTYMIANGLSTATTIRVSNFFGQKAFKSLREASFASLQMTVVFMLICAFVFVGIAPLIARSFTSDVLVIETAVYLLGIAALFQLFDGGQVVMLGALRGMSDVKKPTYIALFSYWIISLPTGYYLAFTLGWAEKGIWYGYLVGLFFASILLFWRFSSLSKRMEKNTDIDSDLEPAHHLETFKN